jgi:hypothetical protein
VGNKGAKKGMGPWGRKMVKNDRYHNDQGERENPMRYESNKGAGRTHNFFFFFLIFTTVELYSDLNNTIVLKCPNY